MAQQAAPAWRYPHPDPAAARRIASRLGLHPVVGQILLNRGLADPEAAREFLSPGRPASLPWRLPGVKAAAWRMLQAVRRQEPVVVYGDYDADGQTSTAILIRALRRLGARVRPFIPHRLSQGYGLHQEVLVEMADRGVRLVVAVDCGLTALEAVREAGRRGLDVVVVDHHEPGPRLPEAAAVGPRTAWGRCRAGRPWRRRGWPTTPPGPCWRSPDGWTVRRTRSWCSWP
ncbi:MAG TPA: DHH family phosphoesterase, partial [Limnochordales bacterium]